MAHIKFWERFNVPNLENPKNQTGNISIDPDRCIHCSICVRICPGESLELGEDKIPRFKTDGECPCVACGACSAACPEEAISVIRQVVLQGRFFNPYRGPLQPPRLFSELAKPEKPKNQA